MIDFNQVEIINKFMKESISIGTNQFYLQNYDSALNEYQCKEYVNGIVEAAKKIKDKVYFYNFRMDKADFEDIVIGAQHAKVIMFHKCHLQINEECNFHQRLFATTFEELDFDRTGLTDYGNWRADGGATFRNIIIGLGKEQAALKNLKVVDVTDCNISREFAEEVLKENGFENVSVEMKY